MKHRINSNIPYHTVPTIKLLDRRTSGPLNIHLNQRQQLQRLHILIIKFLTPNSSLEVRTVILFMTVCGSLFISFILSFSFYCCCYCCVLVWTMYMIMTTEFGLITFLFNRNRNIIVTTFNHRRCLAVSILKLVPGSSVWHSGKNLETHIQDIEWQELLPAKIN